VFRTVLDRAGFLLRDRQTPAGRATNAALYALNTAFILAYIASTYALPAPGPSLIRTVELSLGALFLAEYAVRVYVADDTRAELIDPYTVIDLVAVLPVFVLTGSDTGFLRGFHTLRVFRFLRLVVDEQQLFGRSLTLRTVRRVELSAAIVLIFFVASGFIYAVEAPANPDIANFGDAFYYTVIAVSTVGFGDIIPTTAAGRWVTVVAVLVGFILVPWQASRLREATSMASDSGADSDPAPESDPETTCPRCGASVDGRDRYCRRCGETLHEESGSAGRR